MPFPALAKTKTSHRMVMMLHNVVTMMLHNVVTMLLWGGVGRG